MQGKYSFNEGKYKDTFAQMFGSGAFDKGMSEAALLGTSGAQVDFAKQLYTARLQAAQEAAARRSYSGGGGRGRRRSGGSGGSGGSSSSSKSTNKLVNQFRQEKAASQLSPLETYNKQQKKSTGVSAARKIPVTPIAKNKNLSAYDQMRLVEADAAWVKRNR